MENRDLPIARLIGASWLLSTSNREQALAALSELTSDPDPRIAMLAETQQWRDQIVTATAQQAELWQEQLLRLDTSLRAGPFFLVGQTLARHGKNAEAALAFMRVAIMHPVQSELAAESLFAAGEQLEKLGNSGGAQTVYRELVQKHPKHPLTAVAEQNLARMAPK